MKCLSQWRILHWRHKQPACCDSAGDGAAPWMKQVEFHQTGKKNVQMTVSSSHWCHSANGRFDFSSLLTKEFKKFEGIFRQDIKKKTHQNNEK